MENSSVWCIEVVTQYNSNYHYYAAANIEDAIRQCREEMSDIMSEPWAIVGVVNYDK